MKSSKSLVTAAVLATLSIAAAQAQTPPPDDTAPNAASSPHQRDATHTQAGETATPSSPDASAASSPHQRAATSGSGKMKMAADTSGADPATFVKKAGLGGMTEVELARLAQTKSQDASVRKFADEMVKDHSKANSELMTLAKGKGLMPPTALDTEHKAIVQKLSAKSGADFDAAYSKQMLEDHEKTIALFEGATRSSDKELASFAKKTLPTLQEHRSMVDTLPGTSRSADASNATRQ